MTLSIISHTKIYSKKKKTKWVNECSYYKTIDYLFEIQEYLYYAYLHPYKIWFYKIIFLTFKIDKFYIWMCTLRIKVNNQ